jgi:TPR repeat protein
LPNLRDAESSEASPPYELNPLTNPDLERNLGRWAKVYFSNPPANRERAVNNLLTQIRREAGVTVPPAPIRAAISRDPSLRGVVCSACQRQNPPGHRYCSRCGESLTAAAAANEISMPANPVPETPSPRADHDVQWLRDQAFSGSYEYEVPQTRGWKYLLVVAVIGLAGFAYMQWNAHRSNGAAAPASFAPSVPVPPQNSLPTEAKPLAVAAKSKPATRTVAPAREVSDRAATSSGVQAASQKSSVLGLSQQSLASTEGGLSELRLAQRYLGGSMGVRDPSEAAKLLWKAVRQQNTTAALLLSGLYLRGDGVPRSCDQARLLLTAAARRGTPQAAQQLQILESQGCH